jgi:hypothetical protein
MFAHFANLSTAQLRMDMSSNSYPFVAQRMEMPAYPEHMMPAAPLNDHVPGFAVVGWMTRFPLQHFGDDWLLRGTMEIRYRQHLCVGDPLTISVRTVGESIGEAIEFSAARPGGGIVTSGRASFRSAADTAELIAGFESVPLPVPSLVGDSDVIAGQPLGILEVDFDAARDNAFVRHLAADDPWQGRSDAHPAFIVSAANVLIRSAIDFVDGRWLQGGANIEFFQRIPDGSQLTFTGRMGKGFTAGVRVFSMAEILVAADGVPSMRVDIPFLCRS